MSYSDNAEHKKIIDCVLQQNARMFANLGQDSSRDEYQKAKKIENEKLKKILDLDTQKISRLIVNTIDK